MKHKWIAWSVFGLMSLIGCNGGRLYAPMEQEDGKLGAAPPASMVMMEAQQPMVDTPETPFNTEEYERIEENPFKVVRDDPVSTFSIDVDTASYANVRRYLSGSQLPPPDAVRIEEMINTFTYDYPNPTGPHPFSFTTEISDCPWAPNHRLLHIGIQGKKLDTDHLKPSNLVFLIDASGSMRDHNKLPLLKKSLMILLNQLDDRDHVAIVAYAGAAGLVLPSTPATQKNKIREALDRLEAGGSTAGGAGINLAYSVAEEALIPDGNNRVILATDGDFNVGVSSTGDLVRLIEEKRQHGIYLTILGFGMGNYKDSRMERISNAGNGNYHYIDHIDEAQKVFGREMRANLFTIAKDVKIQIEFNPNRVEAYRLIGYENRMLQREDFNDDTIDAGELGAGHTVTALYELVLPGSSEDVRQSDPLKYQNVEPSDSADSDEWLTIKFRYKPPESDESLLIVEAVSDEAEPLNQSSENFRFSAAVAGFGMLLRQSKFAGELTFDQVIALAEAALGPDEHGDRAQFLRLVRTAQTLSQSDE